MPHHQMALEQTHLSDEPGVPGQRKNLPEGPIPGVENQDPGVVPISHKQGIEVRGEGQTLRVTPAAINNALDLPYPFPVPNRLGLQYSIAVRYNQYPLPM